MSHYVVELRQPVEWAASVDCPRGTESWTAYLIRYGVLAGSENEARKTALAWQSRSATRPAEIVNTERDGGPYTDHPGVTWRTQPAEPD